MAERSSDVSLQVRELFAGKASTWSAKYASDGALAGRLTRLADTVTYHLPVGGRVLDLGCGSGELARRMAAAGLRVTGCDISPEMLGHAQADDCGHAVSWVQLEPGWRTLPFESGSFQAVLASSVIEYVDHPLGFLRECARVLSASGVILCTTPNLAHPIRWFEWIAAQAAAARLLRPIRGRSVRLDNYLAYLHVSRQRHSAKWWASMAAQAGLFAQVPSTAGRSPLRLLVLQCSR